jgi:hypothetical protein
MGGATDARPLALFRIVFGVTLLVDLVDRAFDLTVFYSDAGLVPTVLLPTLQGRVRLPWLFDAPWTSALLFAIAGVAALAFTLGVRARAAALYLWLFETALALRNDFVTDGSDLVMALAAFWSIFADVAAAWSLRPGPRRLARVLPVRLLELQVALIYLSSGISKSGDSWRHGNALYYALQLNNLSRPLGMMLLGAPALCRVLTFATLAIELAYAPLVLAPRIGRRTRPLAALLATAFHLGTLSFMRVGMFPLVMIAMQALLVPATWLDALERRLRRRTPPVAAPLPPPSPVERVIGAALVAQMALVVWSLTPLPVPSWLRRELALVSLVQQWAMFAPDVMREDGYFSAVGQLRDGRTIEPLSLAAPRLLPQSTGYSRWFKLRENLAVSEPVQALVLRYLCAHVSELREVTLTYHQRTTREPGQAPQPYVVKRRFFRRCPQ